MYRCRPLPVESNSPLKRDRNNAATWLLLRSMPLLLMCAVTASGKKPAGTGDVHKHKAKIEVWSLCTRVENSGGNTRYCALFFLSGKLFMVSGNFVHYGMLEYPSLEYTHENQTLVPPLKKVHHDFVKLDEHLGNNSLTSDTVSGVITMGAEFERLKAQFTITSRKPKVTFREIIGSGYVKRKFDWYLLPRCRVTMITGEGDAADTLTGTGHFQQFWGKTGGADCDWIVVHTRGGYDLIITRFTREAKKQPWVPGDYLFMSEPDGSVRKLETFTISVTDQWESTTGKRFPTGFSVGAQPQGIELTIKALTPDQSTTVAGKEYWYGFGSVQGTIRGENQEGWAYSAPQSVSGSRE
jgi:hypothetical protein